MNNPYLYPYYPNGYQQNPQMYQPNPINNQQKSSPIIWVQGEAGAKSFLVAPGETVSLWDSESQTIYLKSADGSGMPSMKILDYTVRDQNASEQPKSEAYVTKDEFHSFEEKTQKKLEKIMQRMDREDE